MRKRSEPSGLLRVVEKPVRYEAAGVSFRVKHVLLSDRAARKLARGGPVACRLFCAAHQLHEIGDGDMLRLLTQVLDGPSGPTGALIGIVHESDAGSASAQWTCEERESVALMVLRQIFGDRLRLPASRLLH